MKTKTILSIEGLGAAGKSGLISFLKYKRINIIPEISDEYKETKKIQKFSINQENIHTTNEWFLQKEHIRIIKAIKAKTTVVMDRSIYSQITYNFARDKIYHTNELVKLFKSIRNNELKKQLFPGIIFINITPKESINRMILRNKNSEKKNIQEGIPPYNEEYMNAIVEGYTKIIPVISPQYIQNNAINIADKEKIYNWVNSCNIMPDIKMSQLEERLL